MDRGGALEPRRRAQQQVCGRQMESNLHRRLALLRCAPQPETLICRHGSGLSAEARLQRSDVGRGPGLAAWKEPEKAGLWQLRVYSE